MKGNTCAVIEDAFPRTLGHCLVVPNAHVTDFFTIDAAVRSEMIDLLFRAKALIQERHAPEGWNVRVNVGKAGGQTVEHAHIHLVPRYSGTASVPVESL